MNKFIPISKIEYQRLKRYYPESYHEFTARVGFKYFKSSPKTPYIFNSGDYLAKIYAIGNIELFYPDCEPFFISNKDTKIIIELADKLRELK